MMPYLLHHSMTNVYVGMLNTGMAAITVADFEIIFAVGLPTLQACLPRPMLHFSNSCLVDLF